MVWSSRQKLTMTPRRCLGGVASLGMNVHSHMMHLHHLLASAVCALALVGCAGTQEFSSNTPNMTRDGVYYQVFPESQGTWVTTGSARTNGLPCTWSRTTEVPATIANTIAIGQTDRSANVTLRSGEFFVSYGCQPWRHVA